MFMSGCSECVPFSSVPNFLKTHQVKVLQEYSDGGYALLHVRERVQAPHIQRQHTQLSLQHTTHTHTIYSSQCEYIVSEGIQV